MVHRVLPDKTYLSLALLSPLSYHLSLRYLFCLFLSGRFTQVLMYGPRREKPCLGGSPTRNTQTNLLSYRDLMEFFQTLYVSLLYEERFSESLTRHRGCEDWSSPLLFACNKVRCSRVEAK